MKAPERQFVERAAGDAAASCPEPRVTGGRSGRASGRPCDSPLVPSGLAAHVEKLRADFEEVTGTPFEHFFCPILYRDEPVELCRGHVVNRAFEGVSRAWTVQRKDVDNHFGSRFESGSTALTHFEEVIARGAFAGKNLPPQFRTRVLAGGEELPHFSARRWPGPAVTGLRIADSNRWVFLKRTPEEVERMLDEGWCIETTADLSVAVAVSVIKSAHLTLFALLGYSYALSCSGHLVGGDVLGRIFRETVGSSPREAEEVTRPILREWVHAVRPLEGGAWGKGGTIVDRSLLFAWTGSGQPWAAIVRVPLGEGNDFAVMLPCSSRPDDMATYLDFLRSGSQEIRVKLAQLEPEAGQCGVSEREFPLQWPKSDDTRDLSNSLWSKGGE